MIQQPYSPAAIPTSGKQLQGNYAQSTLLGAFISKIPYAYQIIDSMVRKNPKYDLFREVTPRVEEIINDESVFISQPQDPALNDNPSGNIIINKDYQAFVYANIDKDKANRVLDYRRMAAYAELADCLDEICDECIVKDENDIIVNFQLRGDFSQEVKNVIEKEFRKFICVFDLEDSGWEYFRQFLIDGEIYFENIIDESRPELGVVGLVSIPPELINPVYQNVQNEIIKGYLLRKPVQQPAASINKKDQEELIFLQKSQVTYVHSGTWNEFKTIRLPYIENAKRAYRQLSLIEDSIVIYRLVRAPERLVFKVYTGNMPQPKAEAYLKRLMQQYWSKKNYDTQNGGRMTNIYDPQSMLDSYWFPRDQNGNGTDVTTLPGGCLAMDTKIPLLDGRILTLSEMTEEFGNGKENWIYSTNPNNGNIVPGKVSWAGVTQKSAKVMELTFDNGKKLICTPDHKFPILGKGFVEAKDLIIGENIIPFSTKECNTIKNPLLISIKHLNVPIEVGTLTIDEKEEFHNYHTFALDCGIFTKNSNLGQLDDLNYFLKKLYKSMKVPASRFISDAGGSAKFSDGTEITRDELRFARYIIRIQRQFATSIRDSFIVHLKIKKLWKEHKLKERAIHIEFNVPTSFMAMREQEILKLKFENFQAATGNQSISTSYAQKYYLGLNAEQMHENREWLRKDSAFTWELEKIKEGGPDFRKDMAAQQATGGAGGEEGGGGSSNLPSSGGGEGVESDVPPDFGGGETPTQPTDTGGTDTGGTEGGGEGVETSGGDAATGSSAPTPA